MPIISGLPNPLTEPSWFLPPQQPTLQVQVCCASVTTPYNGTTKEFLLLCTQTKFPTFPNGAHLDVKSSEYGALWEPCAGQFLGLQQTGKACRAQEHSLGRCDPPHQQPNMPLLVQSEELSLW